MVTTEKNPAAAFDRSVGKSQSDKTYLFIYFFNFPELLLDHFWDVMDSFGQHDHCFTAPFS